MVSECKVRCKRCGNEFGYSGWSHEKMREYGHSPPEYCRDCQSTHKREKSAMGISYFDLQPLDGVDMSQVQPGGLGMLYHPDRPRRTEHHEIKFDPSRYGLTRENVHEVFGWLDDPQHQVVVVVGETGSGKSTALPVYLMFPPDDIPEDHFTRNGQILITQPRIIATQGIAEHLGEDLLSATVGAGYDIGYRHSKDRNADWRNRCYFMTDGTLLNMLERYELGNVSVIMIDEAHERSQNIDTILRLLKKQLPLFPHLKLIIASATIDAEHFRDTFGTQTATIVQFRGKKQHGYQTNFALPNEALDFSNPGRAKTQVIDSASVKTIWLLKDIMNDSKTPGDILVFVPGMREIEGVIARIEGALRDRQLKRKRVQMFQLHRETPEDIKRAIRQENKNPNLIRIFVSTNIAEASVTIDGLVYVIDCGLENQAHWDGETNQTVVEPVTISKANAKQRWGRCGRNRPGVVFCLYTEEQFEAFLDYPVPDMERLSAENVILNAKAAGLRDDELRTGWLDTPPDKEFRRSLKTLAASGVIDEQGQLTRYGLAVRHFSYPMQIARLITTADQLGCVVEVASLIPVLRNGGLRRLLIWDKRWDAYTKREVNRIHLGLQVGCLDDVEFILKLFSLWENPAGKDKKASLDALRGQWCAAFFVNHDVVQEIEHEREQILEQLYGRRRESSYRNIDFSLIDRVRLVLGFMMPELAATAHDNAQLGSYRFAREPHPLNGSVMSGAVYLPAFWKEQLNVLREQHADVPILAMEFGMIVEEAQTTSRNQNIIQRVFRDQSHPIGIRAVFTRNNDGGYAFDRFVGLREPIYFEYREEVEVVEDPQPSSAYPHLYELDGSFTVSLDTSRVFKPANEITTIITDFRFTEQLVPVVMFEPVRDPRTFDAFRSQRELGSALIVEVVDQIKFEEDGRSVVAVRDPETGFEVLMNPQDLTFTSSPNIVGKYPVGSEIYVVVRDVKANPERVKLSGLPYIEQWREEIFTRHAENDICTTDATVLETILWDDEEKHDRVIFVIEDWTGANPRAIYTVEAFGQSLHKPAPEFQVSEQCLVRFKLSTSWDFSTFLSPIPDQVERTLAGGTYRLSWEAGSLAYQGRMSYRQLLDLKTISGERSYHRALERLYHRSNQITVLQVIDPEWLERVQSEYPPQSMVRNLTVTEVQDYGITVSLKPGVVGFIPRSKTYKIHGDLKPGDFIPTAIVMNHDLKHQNITLDIRTQANDPYGSLKVGGNPITGRVTHIPENAYGVFVEIAPGIEGLLHVKQMPEYIPDVHVAYPVNSSVKVRIESIDRERRRISLSTNQKPRK